MLTLCLSEPPASVFSLLVILCPIMISSLLLAFLTIFSFESPLLEIANEAGSSSLASISSFAALYFSVEYFIRNTG